jgi:hypothetical protein
MYINREGGMGMPDARRTMMSKQVNLKPRCFRVEYNEVLIADATHPCWEGGCADCDTYWDVEGWQVGNIAVFDRHDRGSWQRCYYRVGIDGAATLITRKPMKRG